MSILRANLKHLYQKRSFWFLGLFFGAVAFGIAAAITQAVTRNKQGVFCAPIPWMFFIGTFIATLPIDVLTKPFSYCLPGHRDIPGKFLFSVGLALSFLWSLSFLFYPDLNFVETILACLSAFSIFTIFYWLGVWLVSKYRNWGVVFAVFPLIMLGNNLLNISTIVERTIVESPLPMILSGGMVNFLAWRYWGRASLARRYCGMFWMGAFDIWNREKISKFRRVQLAEKDKKKLNSTRISSGVEEFFVSRISRAETGSIQQYIWGALYKTFGIQVSQQRQDWMRFLMLMLPIILFLGYLPGGGKNILFLMPGMMAAYMSLWVYSSLLICGGRRQRFWSALVLAGAMGIFVTVLTVFFATVTHLIESMMPPLTVKGYEFTFNAFNMNFSLVPLLMIPVVLTIGLIFYKKPMLVMIFAVVIFQILFVLSMIEGLTIMNVQVRIGLVHIIIMFLCSWAVFVGVLRYISMRCCLVTQGR